MILTHMSHVLEILSYTLFLATFKIIFSKTDINHRCLTFFDFLNGWPRALSPYYTMHWGLRFAKVCEQKREQKRKSNATGLRFYPMHSVI